MDVRGTTMWPCKVAATRDGKREEATREGEGGSGGEKEEEERFA